MAAYSTEQRIFIIEEYIRSSESPENVGRAFQVKFGVKVGPDRHTISNLVKKFRKTGRSNFGMRLRKIVEVEGKHIEHIVI
jgi:hypothetical protein